MDFSKSHLFLLQLILKIKRKVPCPFHPLPGNIPPKEGSFELREVFVSIRAFSFDILAQGLYFIFSNG